LVLSNRTKPLNRPGSQDFPVSLTEAGKLSAEIEPGRDPHDPESWDEEGGEGEAPPSRLTAALSLHGSFPMKRSRWVLPPQLDVKATNFPSLLRLARGWLK
jgi:hypothetical protein